jgi:hypothetical protein
MLARKEPALTPLRDVSGEALPGGMLARLQKVFGTGLAHIRLHRGARAEAVAADAGARALAAGEHVVLGKAASPDDIGLMAHEAAHVLQQRGGGAGVWSAGALEAEAAQAAQAARRGERFEVRGQASEPRVQRADEEESPGLIERLILDAVEEFAPELLPIMKQGPLAWIEDKLSRAVDALFDAVTAPVRTVSGIVASLESHFGDLVAWMREAGPKIAAGDCKPLTEAAEKIEQVITGLAAPVVDKIKELAGKAKDFFTGLWDRFGAPAWDFLKRLGGEAWDKLQALGRWIWDKTAPVRDRISRAWTWLKNKLGIGEGPEGQDGILQWVQRKAEQVWDQKIKPFVDRFRKPLMVIGGVLLLLSPAGPIIAIGAGIAGLIMGIRWIKQNMATRDGVVSQRDFLRGTILPALMGAVGAVTGALSKAAAFVLDKLNAVMGGLGEVVGAVAGSIFRVAMAIVQWVADQFRALVAWATDKLKGLADLVASGFDRLKTFLEPLFSVLGEIASAIGDLLKLPFLIAGKLWRLIPACIRNPFVDFLVNQILKRIPIFKDLLDLAELWSQIQADVMSIIRQVFTDHDLIGAMKATFRLVVKVLKIPLALALTVIAKAETAWDQVVAKPLDFLKNILRAMRLGFGNFFGNILSHLAFGVQGWLFGELKDVQVQPPASWTDVWAIFRMVAQILGLTQRHIFELIGKRVGPEIAAKLEKAWNVLVGVWSWIAEAMKDPASIGKHVLERIRDIGKMVLDAAIGWIVENIIKKVTARLLTMLDPTGIMAVVNALIAVYAAVKSAIQYIAELLGILNRVLDTVLDVVAGVIVGAAKSLEDAMHKAMPVMIGFLANFLDLGGIGKKMREIIAGIRQKVDDAILWLIDQALKVGRAILDALFGKKKDEKPGDSDHADLPFNFMGNSHTLRLQKDGERFTVMVASGPFGLFKERLAQLRTAAVAEGASEENLKELDAVIGRAIGHADRIQAAAKANWQVSGGAALRDAITSEEIGVELENAGSNIMGKWYDKVPRLTPVLYGHNSYRLDGHGAISDLLSATTPPQFMAELKTDDGRSVKVSYKNFRDTYTGEAGTWVDWSKGHPDGDTWIVPGTNQIRQEVDIRKQLYWSAAWPAPNRAWKQQEIQKASKEALKPSRKALLDAYTKNSPAGDRTLIYIPAVKSFSEKIWDATDESTVDIDHKDPIGLHWSSGWSSYAAGNNATHDVRTAFYLDEANHQILDHPTNSAKGGVDYLRTVELGFRGPSPR